MDDDQVRVDLHCHTSASYDGNVDPVRLVGLARERGLTHVAITDHDTIDGALAAAAAMIDGITVIVGEEVRTSGGDLILLYVKERIPRGLSPEETVRRAREQDCVVGLAHPFDVYRPSVARGAVRPAELKRLADLADYVEVHNGRVRDQTSNSRAADFAREFGLPQVAVSDSHREREVGLSATHIAAHFETADGLRTALRLGTSMRVRGVTPPSRHFPRFRRAR